MFLSGHKFISFVLQIQVCCVTSFLKNFFNNILMHPFAVYKCRIIMNASNYKTMFYTICNRCYVVVTNFCLQFMYCVLAPIFQRYRRIYHQCHCGYICLTSSSPYLLLVQNMGVHYEVN